MKFLLLIHILVGIFLTSATAQDPLADFLTKVVENGREVMVDGYPLLNLPPLSPLEIGNMTITESPLTEFDSLLGSVDNLVLIGVADFKIEKISVALLPPKLDLFLQWSELLLKGNCDLKGTHNNSTISTTGDFSLRIDTVDVGASLVFKFKTGLVIDIDKVDLKFNVERFQVDFSNVNGDVDGQNLNEYLSALLKSKFDEEMKVLIEEMNEKVYDLLKQLMEGMV